MRTTECLPRHLVALLAVLVVMAARPAAQAQVPVVSTWQPGAKLIWHAPPLLEVWLHAPSDPLGIVGPIPGTAPDNAGKFLHFVEIPLGTVTLSLGATVTSLDVGAGGELGIDVGTLNVLSVVNNTGQIAIEAAGMLNTPVYNNGGLLELNAGGFLTAGNVVNNLEIRAFTGFITTTAFENLALGTVIVEAGALTLTTGVVDNEGAIELTDDGSSLVAGAGLMELFGDGRLSLENDGASLVSPGTVGNRDSHLIHGQGAIIAAVLDNDSLIRADQAGRTLAIDTVTTSNDGTLLASQGGRLSIETGSLANDGLIEALPGSEVGISADDFDNDAVVRATGSAEVFVTDTELDGAGGVFEARAGGLVAFIDSRLEAGLLDADSPSRLQLAGAMRMDDVTVSATSVATALGGALIELRSSLTNEGVIRLEDGVQVDNPVLLRIGGNGSIRLLGADSVIHARANFVQDPGHSIAGRGRLTSASGKRINLRNRGLIDANVAGARLRHLPGDFTTTFNEAGGVMRASGGGILELHGRIDQRDDNAPPGVIEALAGSAVELADTQVRGGTLRALGDGVVRVTGFADLRLDTQHSGLHIVEPGAELLIRDCVVNDGQFRVDGDGFVRTRDGLSLGGAGRLTLAAPEAAFIAQGNGGSQINQADHRIEGQGQIDLTHQNSPVLVNRGLIDANVPGGVLAVVSSDDRAARNLTNRAGGILRASNGGRLKLIERVQNEGRVEALDGSVVELARGRIDGGVLAASGTGFFEVADTSKSAIIDGVSSDAPIRVRSGARLELRGLLTNEGRITLEDGVTAEAIGGLNFFSTRTDLAGSGELVLAGPDTTLVSFQTPLGARVLVNTASHTIRGQGTLALDSLTNRGTIAADTAGGTLKVRHQAGTGRTNNRGLMRAAGGGTLHLLDLSSNANAVIEAGGDSHVVLDDITVTGGVVRALAPQAAQLQAGRLRFANEAELRDLALEGPVTIAGDDVMRFRGEIDNTAATLAFRDTARLAADSGDTLRGGSLEAFDQSVLAPFNAFFRDLQITVHDDARLLLSSADVFDTTITNTTGTVSFASPNTRNEVGLTRVTLNGAASIVDLRKVIIQFNERVTINGSLELSRVPGDDDNLRRINVADGTLIDGAGEIVLADADTRIRSVGGNDTFTLGPDLTVRGGGNLGEKRGGYVNQGSVLAEDPAAALVVNAGNAGVTNQGRMRATGGATLVLDGGGGFSRNTIRNEALIEAIGDGSSVRVVRNTRLRGGTLAGRDGGRVILDDGPTLFDVTLEGPGLVANGEAPHVRDGLSNNGTLVMGSTGNRTRLILDNDLLLGGTGEIVLGSLSPGANDQILPAGDVVTITHGPEHTIRGGGQVLVNRAGMVNHGTLRADGTQRLDIDPADGGLDNRGLLHAAASAGMRIRGGGFTTSGQVRVDAGSVLTRTGVFEQTGGVTTVAGRLSASAGFALAGGSLGGTGVITADLTQTGGVVAPGASPGMLQIEGDFSQGTGGRLAIELAGTAADEFDVLDVTGDARLDGALSVSLDGFLPAVGDAFDVVIARMVSGALLGDGAAVDAGQAVFSLAVVDQGPREALRLTTLSAVPLPAALWLLLPGLAVLLARRPETPAGRARCD